MIVHIQLVSEVTIGFHGSKCPMTTNFWNLTQSFFVILKKRLNKLHSLNITKACWIEFRTDFKGREQSCCIGSIWQSVRATVGSVKIYRSGQRDVHSSLAFQVGGRNSLLMIEPLLSVPPSAFRGMFLNVLHLI